MQASRARLWRRLVLGLTVVALGCPGGRPEDPEPPSRRRPDIVLISLDACRADHLGVAGYGRKTSPFLDQLAAEGTWFPNAFVNTHGTPPSHATILTSLYQETHGLALDGQPASGRAERVRPDALMVQEILRGQGYLTLAVTGGGNMSKAQAFWRGFVAFDDRPGSVAAQKHRLLSLLDRYGDVDQPRFILFHTYEIHSPYAAPPRYNRMFGRPQSSFEPTSENLLEYVNTAKRALAPADLEHIEARYDAEIRFTDDVLRQIFAQLGERGVLDDAIVIITADHGEEFGEHGGLMHRAYLYDELIHVPLIMWGHGRVPPRVDDRMVSSVDIAPTILAAAGAATPEAMAGRDLLAPAPVADLDDAVFSQYGRSRYAIRTRRWKLIVNPPPRGPELYDLEHDPGERSNLAPAQPHTVERLRRRLDAWRSGLSTLGGAPEQVDLTAAERERLEALGYVE